MASIKNNRPKKIFQSQIGETIQNTLSLSSNIPIFLENPKLLGKISISVYRIIMASIKNNRPKKIHNATGSSFLARKGVTHYTIILDKSPP